MSTQEHYIQEDEIDLKELWQTVLKGKKVILIIVSIIVSLTLVYVLKIPNVYKSQAVLIPTASDSGPSLGGLGGLAAIAGVNIGGGAMTPDVAFKSLLDNYEFMEHFVKKNKIVAYYENPDIDENYVFALGFRGVYNLLKSDPFDKEKGFDEKVFSVIENLRKKFSISSDKKTGLITVSYMNSDRSYAPQIVNEFLKDASKYLVDNNLRIIDNKLHYFQKEMKKSDGFELRQSLSTMISKILQDKVMMQSKIYYQCDILTAPSVAYIKDKSKPKRGLIVVVSFMTSIILGVFLVFLLKFLRKEEDIKTT